MNENLPIVTVVALCYNHERFVVESLQSVVSQDYSSVELIIVDDFSLDKSREKILQFVAKNPSTQLIFNKKNIGNCCSFNQALKIAKGKYIIDLSTDDVMLPNRISEQVRVFESSDKIGVVFADADFIDENSQNLGNIKKRHNYYDPVGDVYENLLSGRLFTMPVTMMMRKSVLDSLGGYDETLSYEDFDFWVRSSRICEYAYVPKLLAFQRVLKGSHSTKVIQKHNTLVQSAIKVCEKAYLLNKTESEMKALAIRLRMDILRCALTENFEYGIRGLGLLNKVDKHDWRSRLGQFIIFFKIPLNSLYIQVMTIRRLIRFKTKYR